MADFEAHRDELTAAGASIIAGSSDPEEGARTAIEEWDLTFPVVYGLDPEETSAKIGCGRVGRLTAEDALAGIEDLQTVPG